MLKRTNRLLTLALAALTALSLFASCSQVPPEGAADCTAPAVSGAAAAAAYTSGLESFDDFPHPRVVDSGLKVGYLVRSKNSEATIRSIQQAEIEAAHRGWELIPIIFEYDTNFRDSFQNLMNQGVDAVIIGSTESMPAKQDMIEDARRQGVGVYCNDVQIVNGCISNCTMPNGVGAMELLYKVCEDYGWNLGIGLVESQTTQIGRERMETMRGFIDGGAYPNLKILASQDWVQAGLSAAQSSYEIAQTWLQQFGDELDCIMTSGDTIGINAAEAVRQAGDPDGSKTFCVGMDGGTRAFAYIRNNTPFTYTYAQAFELYTHNCFEIIDAIQVRGLAPGDEGCLISRAGETVYSTGLVITRENCPAVGTNIHSLFEYYDPDDKGAWYNWDDGPGIYKITEYIGDN